MSNLAKTDPPHVEIEVAAESVINIYRRQLRYLKSKDTAYITDLLAGAKDVEHHDNFSIRVGAEINRAAAFMVLEERKGTVK